MTRLALTSASKCQYLISTQFTPNHISTSYFWTLMNAFLTNCFQSKFAICCIVFRPKWYEEGLIPYVFSMKRFIHIFVRSDIAILNEVISAEYGITLLLQFLLDFYLVTGSFISDYIFFVFFCGNSTAACSSRFLAWSEKRRAAWLFFCNFAIFRWIKAFWRKWIRIEL